MERSIVTQLASAVTLTGTAAASTNVAIVGGYGQHTLYIIYNPDTDATNALQVTIEVSPNYDRVADTGDWFPFTGEYSGGTGTITEGTQITFSFPSDGTAAQNEPPFSFSVQALAVRIKYSETNAPGDFGEITAWIISTLP